MRSLSPKCWGRLPSFAQQQTSLIRPSTTCMRRQQRLQVRQLATVRDRHQVGHALFSGAVPSRSPTAERDGVKDHRPPDERTLKLGKTIRTLQQRLPTLLVTPLPQEILSPHITLQLFPSSHPHLPTVSGKIPYTAALWTSPVAWGRFPVLGNVKLNILSERMVKNGPSPSTRSGSEKLIVRWKTSQNSKSNGVTSSIDKIAESLAGDKMGQSQDRDKDFHGLFLFEFDEEGRILNHIIEHADEGSHWDKTPKVISVTDWLLGRAWGRREEEAGLALGYCEMDPHGNRRYGKKCR